MSDVLVHAPEGDRNPYDSVPWARDPLHPTSEDVLSVGVRSVADHESVDVEWETSDDSGRLMLTQNDEVWSGQMGPFDESCRYRFVGSHATKSADFSDWFPVSVPVWSRVDLTDVSAGKERLSVRGEGTNLELEPYGDDRVRWSLKGEVNDVGRSTRATLSGWLVRLDSGDAIISKGDFEFSVGVDVAKVDGRSVQWRLSWQLESDERLFGTGERFDSFDQRGKTPDVRVYEEYKQQGSRTYFPLPWVLSSRGYGFAIDGAARVQFDLGVADVDIASVTVPTPAASGLLFVGTPKEVVQAYVAEIGLPPEVPMWAFGPWMSGNEWDSDPRVREVVDRTLTENIPATVVVIEAWSDESTFYLFNDTTYDPVDGSQSVPTESMRHGGKWPDPKALVDWLHSKDVRVLLWQIPVLKDIDDHQQHVADLSHAVEADLCVGDGAGGTYRNRGWWFPESRIIDFTNPKAREWWFNKRAYLLDEVGVDGFKTDGGEHLWGRDVSTSDGRWGDEAANEYPTQYLGAYHEFMADRGVERPLTFSRAGFVGSQALPAHWAGDEDSTWEAYRASLTAGLSAATSGISLWGWDLAGFSKELPSAELYKRSTAMAAFTPIMQYHSEHNEHRLPLADRTPWNVAEHTGDQSVTDVYRFYARVRMNLVPYLVTLGAESALTGLPLMRPLALEFPDDDIAVAIDDQFLLGAGLLVAPVMTAGATKRSVYLPDGDWRDLWTGRQAESGWMDVPTPADRIPVYARGGACIPLWMPETIELGASVGLPVEESGQQVLMILPGTGSHTIVDPLTQGRWTVDVDLEGSVLTVVTNAAPTDVIAWINIDAPTGRGPFVQLPAGAARTTIELDS